MIASQLALGDTGRSKGVQLVGVEHEKCPAITQEGTPSLSVPQPRSRLSPSPREKPWERGRPSFISLPNMV